jgi:hypothetical protein
MKTALAFATPGPASGSLPADRTQPAPGPFARIAQAHARPSRYQVADALVTIAVMAWFTAALAGMAGEFHGVPSAPATVPAATRDLPTALPRDSAWPGSPAHARIRLI